MEFIWYISCDTVAFQTSKLKELQEHKTKWKLTPQKKQTKNPQQIQPKKAQWKQNSIHRSQKNGKNYLPKTIFEIFFLLLFFDTLFSLLIQENQKVASENQTLLMADVINSTKIIIT